MILIFLVAMAVGIGLAIMLLPGMVLGVMKAQKKAMLKTEAILTSGTGDIKEIDWCIQVLGSSANAGQKELARKLTELKLELLKKNA
jgi:hypothetical protein